MEACRSGCTTEGKIDRVEVKARFCDFPNHDKTHPINVLSKEYSQYIPSEYNVCYSD